MSTSHHRLHRPSPALSLAVCGTLWAADARGNSTASGRYRLAPGLWLAWALGIALGCVAVHPSQLLEHHLVRVRVKIEVRVRVRVRFRFRVRVLIRFRGRVRVRGSGSGFGFGFRLGFRLGLGFGFGLVRKHHPKGLLAHEQLDAHEVSGRAAGSPRPTHYARRLVWVQVRVGLGLGLGLGEAEGEGLTLAWLANLNPNPNPNADTKTLTPAAFNEAAASPPSTCLTWLGLGLG